ncbi:hypothetical protein PVAP13_8KG109200 [Panicum virgatum]|uniref:Uncharacterized protein n=2 Tax=Panicum virgatum TaxID=38727 RepID=A0A8T0PJ24_PANVG|nr:hypothetical protein PVAP13_8KG109200 [Panicum virgatum]
MGVRCHASFLNFSSCPALEHLEFVFCDVSSAQKISSEYLKCLSITTCAIDQDSRIRICAPNLVSLHLDDPSGKTPILENMLGLAEAFVQISRRCDDRCDKLLDPHQHCDCEYCDSPDNIGDGADNCMILKGLLEAKSLVFISDLDMFIFKSDLRWCPTFKKLMKLLLNEYWCVPDIHALECILEHSPNLEKLTLQLFSKGPEHKVEMNGSFSSMERSVGISEHLKIVKVKCEVIDERVLKVLQFLCKFSIRFGF